MVMFARIGIFIDRPAGNSGFGKGGRPSARDQYPSARPLSALVAMA